MLEGATTAPQRLPFSFQAMGGVGRLVLADQSVGPFVLDRLELEVTDLGTDPGSTRIERFQRRRTRLRALAIRIPGHALDRRVEQVRKPLAALGITQVSARLGDGFVSIRARAADGLAAADLSFRIQLVHAGTQLRALASTVRIHGHLPSPGPVIADRILSALLGATEEPDGAERPRTRGLCDVEVDLIRSLLWQLMPPNGWRLPAVSDVELTAIRIGRGAIEIGYGPAGTRSGELGVRPGAHQLAAAHDLMHSVDQLLRDGHLEEAMRGYRALLASGGPDQPLLLERILALASARPAWFFDGLELARQALGRWPSFAPAHSALASIMLAQGDAREAAAHLQAVAQLASGEGDDDQAALAALAGARLLRVLEPKAATQLYQLALEHDPGSTEAADSLADRLADEQRWPELVRLVRARAVSTSDTQRAVQLRLRLADVFVHQLGDPASAQQELAAAATIAPDDPSIHEMTATVLATSDPPSAIHAWHEVARLAEERGDHRTCARAYAILGDLFAPSDPAAAESAWKKALELDSLQAEAIVGLATAASRRGDHAAAAGFYERMRGLGLPQHAMARHELALARALVALGRIDDARGSLRRATLSGGETAAEAHAVLAEIAEATHDREHAAAELDTAITSFVDLASEDELGQGDRLYTRAAELAVTRAVLLDRTGQAAAATADYQRAHALAAHHAPALARDAAKTMLARAGDDAATERRWIDAVLATRPPAFERAALLVRRADVRRRERSPDLAAALADLHESLQLTEDAGEQASGDSDDALATRKRAYQLEAELLAQSGDRKARAQALAALAKLAERAADRAEVETAAAAAWLAADEPAAALPHGARAHESLEADAANVPAPLRREVLATLGEAAWRQRAWPDVIRAYRGLIADPGAEAPRLGTFRYRLAVAADRSGDPALAIDSLRPLVDDVEAARAISPELRGQALRLFADLAERAGDLAGAAVALESFASLAVDSSPTARADAMYRAGELFRRAERGDDAIRCLEAALRISDTHLPALDALEAAWRERGDLERVSVILGRKVAATARHPARQKPLLSRLGDLQAQLGRPDVALATHQRALEIDPTWRPSLRYVTVRLRDAGQIVAAAGGLAQLAGELPADSGTDLAVVARERQIAAIALAELVLACDDAQLDAIREVAQPALERTSLDAPTRANKTDPNEPSSPLALTFHEVAGALARLRGEAPKPRPSAKSAEEDTQSGRLAQAQAAGGALSLRDAAARARASGKLDEAFATLEAANHVSPGDAGVLRELVELAAQLADYEAAAKHLATLAELATGARRGETLLELADVFYDKIDDPMRGRHAMRAAADAFGAGSRRRDTTLRMLGTEAAAHLAWDIAVEALSSIASERRTAADVRGLALALARAGREPDAVALLEDPAMATRLGDDGELLAHLRGEAERKAALDQRAEPEDALEVIQRRKNTKRGHLVPVEREPARAPTTGEVPVVEPASADSASDLGGDTPGPASEAVREWQHTAPTKNAATRLALDAAREWAHNAPTKPWATAEPELEAAAQLRERVPDAVPAPAADPAAPTTEASAEASGRVSTRERLPRAASEPAPVEPEALDDDAAAEWGDPDLDLPGRTTDREMQAQLGEVSVSRSKTWPGTGSLEKAPAVIAPSLAHAESAEAADATDATDATEATDEPAEPAAADGPPQRASSPGVYSITRGSQPMARIKLVSVPTPPPQPAVRDEDLRAVDDEDGEVVIADVPLEPPVRATPPEGVPVRDDEAAWVSVSDPKLASGPIRKPEDAEADAAPSDDAAAEAPSVVISGTPAETATALAAAAASADRERLLAARRDNPDDPAMLAAVLMHLGNREPALRREVLEDAERTANGRALAIALHELALMAREARDAARATSLWTRAFEVDPEYAPVWMHLADVLAAADDLAGARMLYEKVAASADYDATRRAFAADRAEALAQPSTDEPGEPVEPHASGESGAIRPPGASELDRAIALAEAEDWQAAIAAAEKAAAANATSTRALELLEKLYLETGDVTSASEAIGRQLMVVDEPTDRAALWRRRAKLYRDTLGRDAEAYRCLKEAHACSPADPEIAYQLRTAAMVRGEWALAASLLYREIASASTPRDRGALHLELALIYEERLDDDEQAQVNYEQALAFDPSIPAAKLPLARRYAAIGRYVDAARLFEEAAATARAADRLALFDAASKARIAAAEASGPIDMGVQLEQAEAAGDIDAALNIAHQLWRAAPGHPTAFRVLAKTHRASGDLGALTDLTAVRAAKAENPDDRALAWLEVARLAEDIGALDQAARAYDHALIEDPGHIGALDARGALAFRLGDFATADLIYRDLAPGESVLGDDELALRRSIIAEQLGRDREALDHAKAASEAAPGRRDIMMRVQELATRCGELATALAAARSVLELVPLDDDDAQLATLFALVDLQRQTGDLDAAIGNLERILRDHPLNASAIEQLAELQIERADWQAATRYLYQLVPLAPTPGERAERLYRLGEAVLVHLGDTDRADDVFLRASDLDPSHVPTLRRLLDVYWRADDPGALVEVATELADKNALVANGHSHGQLDEMALAHALIAAALVGDTALAQKLDSALGDRTAARVATALGELAEREGRLQLATASTAIAELATRGLLDLGAIRAAAAGTPVASVLPSS
ncbi:MAG TPA: hypothetical protein VFQ53_19405 [Kofleriaceae bacterium]|nr:hypothetical protein [Kofleriaceae bacterium]